MTLKKYYMLLHMHLKKYYDTIITCPNAHAFFPRLYRRREKNGRKLTKKKHLN